MRRFIRENLPLVIAFLAIFFAGWQLGFSGYQLSLRLNPPELKVENKRVNSGSIDFSLLWQVLDRINADYLFRPVDGKKLLYGAVSGLVNALGDPYTSFLDPEENSQFNDSLEGVYEGIGAELGIRDNQLIIVAPLEGSPAQQVGIRPSDKILEIDGVSTAGLLITDAVAKIRGASGTKVELTLQRGTGPAFKVTITRDRITVKSVRFVDKGGGIYYFKVSRFGSDTSAEWDEVVAKVKSAAPKGLVLDLRSNPGGYLSAAVYLSSEFLRGGVVAIQEDSSGGRHSLEVESTKNNHAFAGVPVVVLIDRGSASASEIVAAALREKAGARLVGERSFGKGTVQDAEEFSDGSGLHLSVAKWLTPSGEWIHEKGLNPDFTVTLTEAEIAAGRDPQLDKALELLK